MIKLYRYLEAQLVVTSAAAAAARRKRRVHGRTWRNSFLLGAVGRLAQRLEARRAETTETEENSGALVVVRTAVTARLSGAGRSLSARVTGHRSPVARTTRAATRRNTSTFGDPRLRRRTGVGPVRAREVIYVAVLASIERVGQLLGRCR